MREPRRNADAETRVDGGPQLERVVILTTAEPLKTFQVKVTSFTGPPKDWDPDAPDSKDSDLWTETERVISNVRYGLPSADTLEPDTVGWIAWYQGRPYLIIAECS